MNAATAVTPPLAPETPIPALAMVRRAPDELSRFSLEPTDFDGAIRAANVISQSGMFGGISMPQVLVRILTGRSLGIPMMVAMVHVYDVEGRPSVSARLKAALCLRHPDCELLEYVSGDATQATYRIKRRGQDAKVFKFTIEQAKAAGLLTREDGSAKKGSGWLKWPHRMLQARAVSEAVDVVFPEAAMGLSTFEEGREDEMVGEVVATAPNIAQPVEAPHVVTRQWTAESSALKERLATAIASKDKKAFAAVRRDFMKFHDEAPQDIAEEILRFYNEASRTKVVDQAGATTGYVAPEQRGDAYEGPEIPFG